jgi:hypothetical protein
MAIAGGDEEIAFLAGHGPDRRGVGIDEGPEDF